MKTVAEGERRSLKEARLCQGNGVGGFTESISLAGDTEWLHQQDFYNVISRLLNCALKFLFGPHQRCVT